MGAADPAFNPRFLRERLAEYLRQEREQAGLSQGQAAQGVAWSVSKLQRIETGVVGISATDTSALLGLYGISDAETVDRLVRLAREARRRDRFTPYRKYLSSEYQTLLSYEESASEVRLVNTILMPGLLQIPEYARALLSVKHEGEKLEGLIKARVVRQEILDRTGGPRFIFVIDEAVLHRHVGGREVLLAQLVHLGRMAHRSNLELRVIPFAAREHLGLWEVYVIMTIPASTLTGESAKTIVYREAGDAEYLVHDDEFRIEQYAKSFGRILTQALTPAQTRDLIVQRIGQVEESEASLQPSAR
jgi:transcriptional regulator with XRE-family HTH domain